MSKPSSKVKRKYNKAAYDRYEFSVRKDTLLSYAVEQFMNQPDNSLSALIKDLLADHFKITVDELYVPFHYQKNACGQWIEVPNSD